MSGLCFPDQFIEESGVLKSATISACGALSFSKVYFMNVGSLVFGAYGSIIESSSWYPRSKKEKNHSNSRMSTEFSQK